MQNERQHRSSSLIVTGSSAGGIDALRLLLAGLPSAFPAAVVIAQHLDPTQESRLGEILRHYSGLDIKVIEDRVELLEGVVYVVPANHDVSIIDHEAKTYMEARRGAKPSIDRLFSSGAEHYGEGLIAVILSGMGNDGLVGARTVREQGGTVIVQDPSSAAFPSLPQLIPPTLVDLIAKPEDMGRLIDAMIRRTEPPAESDQQALLRSLLTQLRDRTGIDFLQYKNPTIMRRLSRLMVASGSNDLVEYLKYLQSHPEGYRKLSSAFLIKVTEFFRDEPFFELLRSTVLPQLIADARAGQRELRIWSAGASTGEEAYSLAILVAESLRDDEDVAVRIFATDLDDDAVSFARHGTYSPDSLKHVPTALLNRYFMRVEEGYEVTKRIRNMTVFGQHDLARRSPFPRIDLVVCRNVLIYFTKDLQTRALQLFAFALRDGGFLALGKAESTTVLPEFFSPVNATLKVYRRMGDRIMFPPPPFKQIVPEPADARSPLSGPVGLPPLPLGANVFEGRHATELLGKQLLSSPLGVVIVDRKYDIITINPSARAMLEIHGVAIGDDLIHAVANVDREALRDLLDAALRAETPGPVNLQIGEGAERRTVKFQCLFDASADQRMDAVAIVMIDVTAEAEGRDAAQTQSATQSREIGELSKRVADLSGRQKALLRANDELTRANSELRMANEQFLIHAEESAASNEEIETLNEEMQATNEELETLNEELQATVEELNTTNDELHARGMELERTISHGEDRVSSLETERDGLAVAVEALGGLVAILDDGVPLYVSPALGGESFLTRSDPWASASFVRSNDGRTFSVSQRAIPIDGKVAQLVSFTPSDGVTQAN